PEHRQYLLQQTTLRAFNTWLPVDKNQVEQVRLAIRQQVKITMHYQDEQQRSSVRILWPFALGYFNDKIVLAAWCELRQDFRHFRMDRIQHLS
ncbi:WYL domain-containing protein, partial [Acinetobacter baumannii]